MGTPITVQDGDIVVVRAEVIFGYEAIRRHSRGDLVRLLDTFELARHQAPDATTAVYREVCWKCQGSGFLPYYAAFWKGECLECRGTGLGKKFAEGGPLAVVKIARRRLAAQALRDKVRQEKADAARAVYEQWASAHRELVTQAAEVRDTCEERTGAFGPVVLDLANRAAHTPLTDAQIALFSRFYQQDSERNAKRAAQAAGSRWLGAKDDKIEVTATVAYSRVSYNQLGAYTLLIMVDGDGNRIKWRRTGAHEMANGDTLTVRARIKDLDTDETYGRTTVITQGRVREPADATA